MRPRADRPRWLVASFRSYVATKRTYSGRRRLERLRDPEPQEAARNYPRHRRQDGLHVGEHALDRRRSKPRRANAHRRHSRCSDDALARCCCAPRLGFRTGCDNSVRRHPGRTASGRADTHAHGRRVSGHGSQPTRGVNVAGCTQGVGTPVVGVRRRRDDRAARRRSYDRRCSIATASTATAESDAHGSAAGWTTLGRLESGRLRRSSAIARTAMPAPTSPRRRFFAPTVS